MVRRLPPTELFDLAPFAHAELFAGIENCWEVLGKPLAAYLTARLAREIRGDVAKGAYLVGDDIEIGEGTVVEPGAYIEGPAIIGKHCEVRHGAYVRGQVVIGDRCVVGHATEIKSAIMLDGAKAGHFAYVGDSILGNQVNLGAGTKLANFKLSGDEVVLLIDDEPVPTGMRKLGALLGDGVQTGCNSVTSPGTILGKKTFVFPCVSVRAGIYPSGSRVKR